MENLVVLGAEELRDHLPYDAVIDALAAAFISRDIAASPARSHLELDDGELLMMPSSDADGLGVKLLTLRSGNPAQGMPLIQGVFVLFRAETLQPIAIMDGRALTSVRTAAVSALATRHLAPRDARRLMIFGAGDQGRAHLEAMCAVRPFTHLTVVDPHPERIDVLLRMARERGLSAESADAAAVSDADVICTCTTSETPLFEGSTLRAGAHVNATGSYKPDRRELDGDTMASAQIVVEDRATALSQAGDLLVAIDERRLRAETVVELADVLRGIAPPAEPSARVTVFKSVGLGVEDIAVAQVAVERSALAHAAIERSRERESGWPDGATATSTTSTER